LDDDLGDEDVSAQELKLAKMLIDTTRADDPELDQYHNLYNERLEQLIQAKIAGKEIATPPAEDEAPRPTIDFMQMLKDSLARKGPRKTAKTPARRTSAKRRKTG
jgi:DNA end-binding protein Ku